ncbi:hypothetical protein E2C01_087710 [Portunus trituberculatus]|uniref:Uncharacterized protein n=1 Tax=Portunus trituberculatus TaxID=210409 RepID=A0A5B7J483_PORTR|nr:hypothetical protein [Portunus trituberculatus]
MAPPTDQSAVSASAEMMFLRLIAAYYVCYPYRVRRGGGNVTVLAEVGMETQQGLGIWPRP